MTPERLRQIEDLCHAALARPPVDRATFLADACAGDEALRREVESLLAHEPSAAGFLSVPAAAVADSAVLDHAKGALAGTRLRSHEIDWFDQMLDGVDAAHACGIVHRDLKPENILIVRTTGHADQVKVLDFGLAKMRALDRALTETLSVSGLVAGTFGYMAPEQLVGGDVDQRADIFALGIIVIEALTGRRPFDRPTHIETLNAMQQESLRLSVALEETALASVLRRCLAAEPAHRFASVSALRAELVPALRAIEMNGV